MTYHASDHPRAPKGTPQGGQFTQKAGVGIDDDLEPINLYNQYSNEELKYILSQDTANNSQYDDMRTKLCQRKAATQDLFQDIDINELFTTLKQPDGGATYNPKTGKAPLVGFCFSPYEGRSKKFPPSDQMDDFAEIMQQYIQENKDLFSDGEHYIGFWNDPNTGDIFLDVSVVNYDAQEARDACLQHDQRGFFDLQTCQSVIVDKNATSGQGVSDD